MKRVLVLLFTIFTVVSYAQNGVYDYWRNLDTKNRTSSKLFDHHKQLNPKKNDRQYNDYCLITELGKIASKLENGDLSKLPVLDLNHVSINDYLKINPNLIDDYFTLSAMKDGAKYSDAKTGLLFNTSYAGFVNNVDYKKITTVFNSKNENLKLFYLQKIPYIFRYHGASDELMKLRPLIDNNFVDSELKREIATLYEKYAHLLPGSPAPAFKLKDHKGNEYSLSDYKGKVLVIDVWATWCSGCILKLPNFLKVRDHYKDREDVAFMVVSIDRVSAYQTWKFTHPKYKLMDITSVIASEDGADNSFSKDYNITGIPRYFVIDAEGKIVTVYAPSPGDDLIDIIEKALKTPRNI